MIRRTAIATFLCVMAATFSAVPEVLAAEDAPAGKAVYQCGGQYQQLPCEGGRAVSVPPGPSAEQRQQAKEVAATEQGRADAMRKERLAREAEDAKRLAAQSKAAAQASAKAASKAATNAKHAHKPDCAHGHKRAPGLGKQQTSDPSCEKETYRGSAPTGGSAMAAQQPPPAANAAKLK
jgi:hypothetical protein